MHDALWWGRKLRMLTVVDTYTRKALAIEVDTSISGLRVARVLDRAIAARGAQPDEIVLDNGRVDQSRARPVGLRARRAPAFHPARQAGGERIP